ncbi:MAG: matrixin family metalloprotease [Pyrinomonadaceae bacterium]
MLPKSSELLMFGFKKTIFSMLLIAAASTVFANSFPLASEEEIPNLRWKAGIIRIAVSSSLLREIPNIKRDSDVSGAIARSIDAWAAVANIEIQETSSDKQSASPAGLAGDGVSLVTIAATPENVLLFAKDPENAAATTRVFYNKRGMITEADIVLNPYLQFSTDGTIGTFDLESTLTHEIGHLLGLPHSPVFGSTMHANYGKNGVFGLQNFTSRTLAADDIAAVRALYGGRSEDSECCGNIAGSILLGTKSARNFEVWIEDSNGRVNASTRSSDGEFHFSGVNAGKYRVFAQDTVLSKSSVAAREIGEAVVASGETTTVAAKAVMSLRDVELTYLGFNGQLSEVAVSLSAGRTYVIYLGGKNLDPKRLFVTFTTPYISVVPGSMRSLDYGDQVSVVSLEVRVSPRATKGEYTVFAESERGGRRAIIGGLTIDNFTNPWNTFGTSEE